MLEGCLSPTTTALCLPGLLPHPTTCTPGPFLALPVALSQTSSVSPASSTHYTNIYSDLEMRPLSTLRLIQAWKMPPNDLGGKSKCQQNLLPISPSLHLNLKQTVEHGTRPHHFPFPPFPHALDW